MGIYSHIFGSHGAWYGHYFDIDYAVFRPDQQPPPPPAFISRGGAPSYGSGPYFKAVGSLTIIQNSSGQPLQTNPVRLYHEDMVCDIFIADEGKCITVYQLTYKGDSLYQGSKSEYYFRWDTDYPFYVDMIQYVYVRATGAWRENYNRPGAYKGNGVPVTISYTEPEDYSSMYEEFLQAVEANYFRQDLEDIYSSLYVDACSNIPQSSVNQMENVWDIFNFLKYVARAVKDPTTTLAKLFKDLTDPRKAWLAYRYTYRTTSSDISDLVRVYNGLNYLNLIRGRDARYHALTTEQGITRRVSLSIKANDLIPNELSDLLGRFGGIPSLADIWDMIPYSFIADWFVQIGSVLESWEQWDGIVNVKPTHIWFSASKDQSSGGFVYYRVPGHVPIVPPLYRYHTVSGKTWTMRIADAISLFT